MPEELSQVCATEIGFVSWNYPEVVLLTSTEPEATAGGSRGGGVECHTAGRDTRLALATVVAPEHRVASGGARCLVGILVTLVVQWQLVVLALVLVLVVLVLVLMCGSSMPLGWLLHAAGSRLPQAVGAVRYLGALLFASRSEEIRLEPLGATC